MCNSAFTRGTYQKCVSRKDYLDLPLLLYLRMKLYPPVGERTAYYIIYAKSKICAKWTSYE